MLASLISFYYFCNHKYQYIEEKKIVIIMMMALMMPAVSNAQNDAAKKLTKFEQTTSKTGRISKFVDVRMPSIPESFMGSLSASIRTVMGEQINSYF